MLRTATIPNGNENSDPNSISGQNPPDKNDKAYSIFAHDLSGIR